MINKQGRIFKFGNLTDLNKFLIDETIGLSSLYSFNDPYEYKFYTQFEENEIFEKLNSNEESLLNNINKNVTDILSEIKVSCFSFYENNPLMWSHYSNKHSGLCYCFDISNKYLAPDSDVIFSNVKYSKEVPSVKIKFNTNSEPEVYDIEDVILTKSYHWEYEKEARLWTFTKENSFRFNPICLHAVIIGRRVSDNDILKIIDLVNKFNERNNTYTKIMYETSFPGIYDIILTDDKKIRDGHEQIHIYKPIK